MWNHKKQKRKKKCQQNNSTKSAKYHWKLTKSSKDDAMSIGNHGLRQPSQPSIK